MDRRTRARELAIQCLYQLDIQGCDLLGRIDSFLAENESDKSICKTAADWVKGTWGNIIECDRLITESTIRWELSRISFVDKSILRLSVYQLKFCAGIPPKVVINEAIELAKKFSTAQSSGFVNGVLDSTLKKIEGEKS